MRRSKASLFVPLVIVCVLGVGTPAPASTGVLFGAYAARRGTETKVQAFQHLETSVGRKLAIVRMFYAWDSSFNAGSTSTLEGWAKASGKVPVISVKTKRTNGSAVLWSDIANAVPGSTLYADIVRWADRMKAWGGTVYLCLNHEASNHKSLANGTAPEYIAAWQKVWSVFRDRGVTNVKWTWIMGDPTPWEVWPGDRRYGPKWYPGDAYTDVLAVDVYNWACSGGDDYRSFASLTQKFLEFVALHPDKLTLVAEFGTDEDPADPNAKANWIMEAAESVKTWPNLVGFMAFHSQYGGGCDWWLDTSQKSLDAARYVGDQTYFGGTGTIPKP